MGNLGLKSKLVKKLVKINFSSIKIQFGLQLHLCMFFKLESKMLREGLFRLQHRISHVMQSSGKFKCSFFSI